MAVVRVWDLPLRLFHWMLVLAVVGMVVTASMGRLEWHMRCGYLILALLLFRLVWGFLGGHWARFSSFVPSPRSLIDYVQGKSPASVSVGHNPLGALSVLAMLLALGLQVASGLGSDDEIAAAGPLVPHLSSSLVSLATLYHTKIGKFVVLGLVVLHIAAIIGYRRKGQDLVTPMLKGDKSLASDAPPSRDDSAMRIFGAACFLGCLALVAWLVRSLT